MTLPLYIAAAVVVFLVGFTLGIVHGAMLAFDFMDLDRS